MSCHLKKERKRLLGWGLNLEIWPIDTTYISLFTPGCWCYRLVISWWIIVMFRGTKFSTYRDYLQSDEWQEKKQQIRQEFPLSYYCWVCDCSKFLDLHHENYESIPNERFLIDLFYLCDSRCRCGNKCHRRVGFVNSTPLYSREILKARRLILRNQYVRKHLRPSTLLYYLYRYIYRKLYWVHLEEDIVWRLSRIKTLFSRFFL